MVKGPKGSLFRPMPGYYWQQVLELCSPITRGPYDLILDISNIDFSNPMAIEPYDSIVFI